MNTNEVLNKLIAEIERRIQRCEDCERDGYPDTTSSEATLKSLRSFITSLQQEQPDTCIFGNTPSESSCNFCGVECALREPKQTGKTSAGLSSKDEAIGLAIMAYLDTKVKHDNDKVCGVSLKVAREWIREKIANKQEQPEVDLEKELRNYNVPFCGWERLTYNTLKEIARHFYELGLNARKEETK